MIDKAKAYDEALENAKKLRDDCQRELDKTDKNSQLASILRAGISAVEMVFPQLTESEDEKFRKYILQCCKECIEANDKGLELSMSTIKKLLVYLEKENEQKHILKFKVGDKVHLEGDGVNILTITGIEEDRYITNCGSILFGAEDIWQIVDQKPADDKAFEEWIDSWFKEHKEKAYPQITMDEKEFKNFCRGIRNMYQQKSDWSEEDEKTINGEYAGYIGSKNWGKSSMLFSIVDKLKSLRSFWKPSEEQMDRLFSIVAALRKDYCDDMADFLANLYADLKKLGVKEEPEYYQHFDPDC